MRDLEDARLRREIDEQVAPGEEVDPGEGRVLQQVVRGEDHALAQLAPRAVAAVLLGKNRRSQSSLTSAAIVKGKSRFRAAAMASLFSWLILLIRSPY